MTKILRTLAFAVVLLCTASLLIGQDLSSQRGESQNLGEMLGHKIDHHGLVINPTPQEYYFSRSDYEMRKMFEERKASGEFPGGFPGGNFPPAQGGVPPQGGFGMPPMGGGQGFGPGGNGPRSEQDMKAMFEQMKRLRDNCLDITSGVKLTKKAAQFAQDIDFLKISKDGVPLKIVYGKKEAKKEGLPQKSGAYTLEINEEMISIMAYDELGAYYGIRTLEQIFLSEVSADGTLPSVYIKDWPDLKYRGVVEGFYGTPWSHQVRLSLIDFYGQYKMNYYIYGPKDDPYHSSPYWRENYPQEQAQNIKELVEACNQNRVHFVWAIHPGQDIKWNEEDYQNLLNKFESMYQLGVRAFAIHFDDISGEGTHPIKQTDLMNRLNEEFVKEKGDVEPMIVCPTDYTRLWANPTERGSLVRYGENLDPSVDVFWTGDAVCSDYTISTMDWVGSRIKRPALFWWNFPVTDYARHIIMQGPVYGLSNEMDEEKSRGIVSNPMEHGQASKLALYSVADYAWNTTAYNPIDSWERAIETLAPEVAEHYRLFAIHSCDTETGYRRYESWETKTFTIEEYTPELSTALREELLRIEAVPAAMEKMKNKALLEELRPWLVEFRKLGTRCRKALELLDRYMQNPEDKKFEGFWNGYVSNLMSKEDVEMFDAHRVGTMKLQPFYERVMDGLVSAYYEYHTGEKSSTLSATGSYKSLMAPSAKYMFDNDLNTYYHSGQGQRTDEFVAADMSVVRPVREISIIQGRNSVDDVDYFDHAIVEYSCDGENWIAVTDSLKGVYEISWRGEPFSARYVRLRKLPSEKRNWLAIRSFEINPVSEKEFGWDGNPFTFFTVPGKISVGIPRGLQKVTFLFGKLPAGGVKYEIMGTDGKVVEEGRFDSSESVVNIDSAKGVYAIVIEGNVDLYEVIR